MNKILIASKNTHKVIELANLLKPLANSINLKQWEEANFVLQDVIENGKSFLENALLKARGYAKQTGFIVLSDDSGLSVLTLNNRPGIYSARYGKESLSDKEKCNLLLSELDGQHNRIAFFTSVLVLAKPSGEYLFWKADVYGLISRKFFGENGFGYDPIFYYPNKRKTFAQLSLDEKNTISHRAVASKKFLADLTKLKFFIK